MLRHLNDPIEPAGVANPTLDPCLAAWIDGLLARAPADRYAIGAELAEG